jgi:carboxylesterase
MFAKGYNVLIPPFPHHGLADRMTEAHAQLVAEELARFSVQAMDITHGLGDRITMAGLSAGGVTTAFAAQTRNDLYRAVIIAPAFGYEVVPTQLTQAASNLFRILPNQFSWWDPKLEAAGSPSHAYPRYSTRALAELLRMGSVVYQAARSNSPAARSIVVVNNAADHAVNNALTRKIAHAWSAHGASVQIHEFDDSQQLGHDLIDPDRSDQKVDIVYPRLMEWMMN